MELLKGISRKFLLEFLRFFCGISNGNYFANLYRDSLNNFYSSFSFRNCYEFIFIEDSYANFVQGFSGMSTRIAIQISLEIPKIIPFWNSYDSYGFSF